MLSPRSSLLLSLEKFVFLHLARTQRTFNLEGVYAHQVTFVSSTKIFTIPSRLETAVGAGEIGRMPTNTTSEVPERPRDRMTLHLLPYDLLFNVAQHLELTDIYALQLVSPPAPKIDSQLLIACIIYEVLQVTA